MLSSFPEKKKCSGLGMEAVKAKHLGLRAAEDFALGLCSSAASEAALKLKEVAAAAETDEEDSPLPAELRMVR